MDEQSIATMANQVEELRPPGPLFAPRPGTFRELREAMALAQLEFRERVRALLDVETDPNRTLELLPEWEHWLGLPDPGIPADPPPSTLERRRAIVGKLRALGGQSPYYFIDVAAELGYVIEIEEFDRSQIGDKIDTAIMETDWEHTWRVHAPEDTIFHAIAGVAVAGDPVGTIGNALLETFFNRIKPAHTVLLFAYDLVP